MAVCSPEIIPYCTGDDVTATAVETDVLKDLSDLHADLISKSNFVPLSCPNRLLSAIVVYQAHEGHPSGPDLEEFWRHLDYSRARLNDASPSDYLPDLIARFDALVDAFSGKG